MGSATAGTKGFLFCDLRGYAAFVEAKGDRAAADLLETYRGLVRAVIASHDGAEIRTEGDSVYVVFPAASSAVEAGLAIVAGAAEQGSKDRPIRVGVGIHAGETVETAEGLVGGAVNIAARVCAKAQAGEVLVTDTVRALTRTLLPYRFVGLGSQSLKGIPGGMHLYRVEAVSGSRAAHLRRRFSAHRRLVAGVVALAALVLVGATAAWAVNRPPDCLTLAANTKDVVARIDPLRMCVVQVIEVGRHPDSIVATDDALWVANETDWTVTKIDLGSRSVVRWFGSPGSPIALAAHADGQVDVLATNRGAQYASESANGFLWIKGGSGDRIIGTSDLPAIRGVTNTALWTGLVASNEWTWVVAPNGGLMRLAEGGGSPQIQRLDRSGEERWATGLAAGSSGTVWIADAIRPTVLRFDGLATEPIKVKLVGSGGTRAAAASPSELWLLRTDGTLTRVDVSTGQPQPPVALDAPATKIAVGPTSLWLLDDGYARAVREIDPGTGRTVGTVEVGGLPGQAAFADGSLWVTVHAP